MQKRYLCFFLLTIGLLACSDNERVLEEQTYPNAFLNLKEKSPEKTLTVISGEILNHAKYTSYGSVSLLVTYYSEVGVITGTERLAYYNMIDPGRRARYQFSIHPPPPPQDKTHKIVLSIVGAIPMKPAKN